MMDDGERLTIKEMQDYSKNLQSVADTCEAMAMRLAFQQSSSLSAVYGQAAWVSTVSIPISSCTMLYEQATLNAVSWFPSPPITLTLPYPRLTMVVQQLAAAPTKLPVGIRNQWKFCEIAHDNSIVMSPAPLGGLVPGEWLVLCSMHEVTSQV